MHFASTIPDLKKAEATRFILNWRSFSAFAVGPSVALQWSLVQPDDSDVYTVHHSRDGVNWATIASLPARKTCQNVAQYRFMHNTVQPGLNFYRVGMRGRGEEASLSEVCEVNLERDIRSYSVESNVVSDCLVKIRIRKPVTLQIRNSEGLLLHSSRYAPGLQIIEVPRSALGICWLEGDGHFEKLLIH